MYHSAILINNYLYFYLIFMFEISSDLFKNSIRFLRSDKRFCEKKKLNFSYNFKLTRFIKLKHFFLYEYTYIIIFVFLLNGIKSDNFLEKNKK